MSEEGRAWNEKRGGHDVTGHCWECHQPISYFLDEDGTPRDVAGLAIEQERERLREAIDSLPSAVFLPHDIERIRAGEALPVVTRRALWNLLNPEID